MPGEYQQYTVHYSILGKLISVNSDRAEMLFQLHSLYGRFEISHPDRRPDAKCQMLVDVARAPMLIFSESDQISEKYLPDPELLPSYCRLMIFNYLCRNVTTHFIFHGAAASYGGKAVGIIAGSGMGKTTLLLELLKRGASFLSDDQLVVDRVSRLVKPFPRGLGIRERTLAFYDDLLLNEDKFTIDASGERKWFTDPSRILWATMGENCPIGYIFFLENSNGRDHSHRVRIAVDQATKQLLVAIQELSGVDHLRLHKGRIISVIEFEDQEMRSSVEYEDLCRAADVWMLDFKRGSTSKPAFIGDSRLRSIKPSEAAERLITHLRNDFRSQPAETFMEIIESLKGVPCFVLTTGKRESMVNSLMKQIRGEK